MLPERQQKISRHCVYLLLTSGSRYGYNVDMNLNDWMKANGFGDKKVAELTGLHRTTVWKLRRGLRKPEPRVMDLLVSVSHGAITRPALRPDLYPEHHSHTASAAE